MHSLIEQLHRQLENKEKITREQVEKWRKIYPYFSLPLMMYVCQERGNDSEMLEYSTLYAGNLEDWASQLGLKYDYASLYPVRKAQSETTDSAIELFLQTYGKNEDFVTSMPDEYNIADETPTTQPTATQTSQNESRKNTPLLTIPVYDYMSELESMPDVADAQPLSGEDLLNRFLEADAAGEQLFSKPEHTTSVDNNTAHKPPVDENESFFSESLAKIYIKQRRYAKALEIIRKLSLNNPEKNVYFADQIRFLEKLIINVKN